VEAIMRLGVPGMAALIIGAVAGLAALSGGAQELRLSCAGDPDGALAAGKAQGCAEQRFGADGLAEEQFVTGAGDADGLRAQFARMDEDGDGRISRDEWLRSFGPAHAGLTHGMED
jgi:hypothetical protein